MKINIIQNKIIFKINSSLTIIIKFLEIPKFEIIELPENYNAFIEKYINVNCSNCNLNRKKYLICLFCGAKLCNDKQCVMKYKEQDINSVLIHSKLCSDSQGFFITKESNIIFTLNHQKIHVK